MLTRAKCYEVTAVENFLIATLDLRPHPEGGFFCRTYTHPRNVGDRALCSAIYYLVTSVNPSRMHRVASDEMWHFYLGDSLEMLQLAGDESQVVAIGTNVAAGERPQVLVPAGVWQGARVKPGGRFALVGATVSPGFDYADFEIGSRDELSAKNPDFAELIAALT
jgi:predicted cupin superfamily sugar epimerase